MSSVTGAPLVGSPPTPQADAAPQPSGWMARLLLAGIRAYQFARIGRVSPCRFTPTCSRYAMEAVSRHGSRRGLALAIRRLGRCRPGGPYGYDPVPEHPLSRVRDL
jgi:uncharacterized protein